MAENANLRSRIEQLEAMVNRLGQGVQATQGSYVGNMLERTRMELLNDENDAELFAPLRDDSAWTELVGPLVEGFNQGQFNQDVFERSNIERIFMATHGSDLKARLRALKAAQSQAAEAQASDEKVRRRRATSPAGGNTGSRPKPKAKPVPGEEEGWADLEDPYNEAKYAGA